MIKIKVGEYYYYQALNNMRIIKISWRSSREDFWMIEVIKGTYHKTGRCFYYNKKFLQKYCRKIPKLKRMLLYGSI